MIVGIRRLFAAFLFYSAAASAAVSQQDAKIRHEVSNHTVELRVLAERLKTHEELIEALREDMRRIAKESQELAKSCSQNGQARIADLEAKCIDLQASNQALVDLIASYREALNKSQGRIDTLEASVDQQRKNSRLLESSLTSLIEAVGAEPPSGTVATNWEQGNTYKVLPGDSLERIARRLKVSTRSLKEANNLENDLIMVGQKLKIPKPSS